MVAKSCRGTCYLVLMFVPPKFMLRLVFALWYIIFACYGKRHMEATVVKMCKRYEMAWTKGTFKTRRHK